MKLKPYINSDSTIKGAVIGIILPIIGFFVFLLIAGNRFDTIAQAIKHFQAYNILYKALSLSLMPNAALFFLWSKINKINQARGVLIFTLFYGVGVVILYMI